MNREQMARKNHNSGYSCASAVYSVFKDKVNGSAPIPRSEGGKCGAVLAAEKVLKQLGLDSEAFDQQFVRQFRSLKCDELRRARYSCNDLVGSAARLTEDAIGNCMVDGVSARKIKGIEDDTQ